MKIARTLIATGVLSALSLPAFAQLSELNPGDGNGGLAFVAWDRITGVSLVEYLNVSLDDVLPGNIDSTPDFTLTGFGSAFGSSVNTNIEWLVVAADGQSPGNFDGLRLASTSSTDPTGQNTAGVNSAILNLTNLFSANASTCPGAADFCVGDGAPVNIAWAGSLGDNYADVSGSPDEGAGGTTQLLATRFGNGTLNFYYLTTLGAGEDDSVAANVTPYLSGLWQLTNSTLAWTGGGSVVPLPAAGWLLISGLIGAFSLARRREAAPAPAAA